MHKGHREDFSQITADSSADQRGYCIAIICVISDSICVDLREISFEEPLWTL